MKITSVVTELQRRTGVSGNGSPLKVHGSRQSPTTNGVSAVCWTLVAGGFLSPSTTEHPMSSPRREFIRRSALALAGIQVGRFHLLGNSLLTLTARHFLEALDEQQRANATFDFMDAERQVFHFTPILRRGLPLLEMRPEQQHLANALLSAGLSRSGYIKATTIMSLEEILRVLEKDSGQRRNPGKYYFSIFGTPTDEGIWDTASRAITSAFTTRFAQDGRLQHPRSLGQTPVKSGTAPGKVCGFSRQKRTSHETCFTV